MLLVNFLFGKIEKRQIIYKKLYEYTNMVYEKFKKKGLMTIFICVFLEL